MGSSDIWSPAGPTIRRRAPRAVVGERGSLHSDGTSLTVILRGSSSQTYDFEAVDSYVSEIGHFANCLRSRTRPLHTEREGIDVLCLILAAYEVHAVTP
jgi:predicted dehydrogenase